MINKFKIAKFMATVFTPEFHIGNTLSLANIIQNISGDKFNGEFISVPIPQEAPPEIPRIIMNSQDGTWKLEVSLLRTNLLFLKPINLSVDIPEIEEFGKFACNFFGSYKRSGNTKIQKIGLVSERFLEFVNDPPSQFIAEKFCNEHYSKKIFDNTISFEIHSLKKYNFEDFNINSWIRFRSAKLATQTKTPVLLVENDINTYGEEDKEIDFDVDNIMRFFTVIPVHINNILKLFLEM
ncbi:MAG: hypothetical protein V2I97_04850 [Desulfococcaceae bacterium]|jgi:hypothetical protein|nr:hypothetical protein [Desulfococcaceae bacterium]